MGEKPSDNPKSAARAFLCPFGAYPPGPSARLSDPGISSDPMHLTGHLRSCLRSAYRRTSGLYPPSSRRIHMEAVVYPPYLPAPPASTSAPTLEEAYPHGILSMSKGTTMYDAMARLGDAFDEVPLDGPSPYVRPASILYSFDGKPKRWDIVEALPSVGIVLYHTQLQCFLLVRQFRPPVYSSKRRETTMEGQPAPSRAVGFTYELCAGLVDKAKSLKQIACEEIMEEVGYEVPVSALLDLGCALASAGTSGAQHYMFFATVDESMRAQGAGGGLQDTGECIEVLALPLERVQGWVVDGTIAKSPGAMFGLTWGYHAVKAGNINGVSGSQSSEAPNPNLTEELTLRAVLPS